MGKIINWAVIIGIGYFLYTYFSTGDVTLVPPKKAEVTALASKSNKKLQVNERAVGGEKCKRIGGGWLKQGIYSCEVNIFEGNDMYGTPKDTYTIKVEKKNSQWQIKP